jgi:iron-sulfur cluster repair protein YtfE (RIC family)
MHVQSITEGVVEEMTVNQPIQRFPASVAVFAALGIDTCCGGAATLAEAAARKGVPLPELLKALRQAAAQRA